MAGMDRCPHVYWWHGGKRERDRNLPPKKTRQLIYALYKVVADLREKEDLSNVLIDYIDADSCPPKDHFKAAAIGITVQGFDVLQATNVAGNPLNSMAATMNALDHMAWDGWKYAHQSSGKTPFWVLGKGLFYKASDLVELGGFNPWVTIEDPEVGMRFHKNGKRLGIIEGALIEEVPDTFRKSVIQRKRWVAGFWQSLTSPLTAMGYTFKEKLLAWLIFVPCLSLQFSAVYAFISAWQTYRFIEGTGNLPEWVVYPAVLNLACLATSLSLLYVNTWKRTRLVLDSFWLRVWYMVRINPLFILLWWLFWTVPLTIGFWMFLTDKGLIWQRTEKLARHRVLVLDRIERGTLGYVDKPLLSDQTYHAAVLGSTFEAIRTTFRKRLRWRSSMAQAGRRDRPGVRSAGHGACPKPPGLRRALQLGSRRMPRGRLHGGRYGMAAILRLMPGHARKSCAAGRSSNCATTCSIMTRWPARLHHPQCRAARRPELARSQAA